MLHPGIRAKFQAKHQEKKNRSAETRPRAGTGSTTRLFALESVRVGVVGNISACHADAPGSIPGRGVFFSITNFGPGTVFLIKVFFFSPTAKSFVYTSIASIAQLAEHLLRKEKVTSSILVGGWQFAWSSWL